MCDSAQLEVRSGTPSLLHGSGKTEIDFSQMRVRFVLPQVSTYPAIHVWINLVSTSISVENWSTRRS